MMITPALLLVMVVMVQTEVVSTSPKVLFAIGGALAARDAPRILVLAKNHGT